MSEARQAARLPNPELDLELEDFGGSKDGFREAEASIAIRQPVELGGKRSARRAVADKRIDITAIENEIQQSAILGEVEVAYARLQRAVARQNTSNEREKRSRAILRVVRRKLQAGAILAVEETKAKISWQRDKASILEATNELYIAKVSLASLWKGNPSDIGSVDRAVFPQNIERYLAKADPGISPQVRLEQERRELFERMLRLEQSLAVPDINVGLGYKRSEESRENSLLGVFSIELPLLNRNRDSIERARKQILLHSLQVKSTTVETSARLLALQQTLRQLIEQYQILDREVLPSAKKAFEQADRSYKKGRSSYLELNDAQDTLFDSNIQKSDLLFAITKSIVAIRQITGENLAEIRQFTHGDI